MTGLIAAPLRAGLLLLAMTGLAAAQPLPPARPTPPAAPSAPAQAPSAPAAAASPSAPAASASAPQSTDSEEEAGSSAQATQGSKCEAYRKSFDGAVARLGKTGLGPDFMEKNAAFIASNCAGERNVCPRSKEELRLANVIVMAAVSGAGGTFMPFACRGDAQK